MLPLPQGAAMAPAAIMETMKLEKCILIESFVVVVVVG
jgi:hypothetical protein